jgi:hypothetical protein
MSRYKTNGKPRMITTTSDKAETVRTAYLDSVKVDYVLAASPRAWGCLACLQFNAKAPRHQELEGVRQSVFSTWLRAVVPSR